MERQPAVYMLASRRSGTLYVGVTSDLVGRIWQHRSHLVDGFSKRYAVDRLVWFELAGSMEAAILREKQLKKWKRSWKIELSPGAKPGLEGSLARHHRHGCSAGFPLSRE